MADKMRPRYHKGARSNAGMTFPEFVLHAALKHLPEILGKGLYAKDAQQEVLFTSISQDMIDACFHKLQQRPPSIALQFPVERIQLPQVTIRRENMPLNEPIIGDDAGMVEEETNWVTDETVLTPEGGAVGGETHFSFAYVGELVTRSIGLVIRRGSDDIPLDYDASDFQLGNNTLTLDSSWALQAGDALVVTRYATYGLSGGDLYAYQYRFNYVIFIETENAMLTSFLAGLVWRELVLKYSELLAAGLVDLEIGFRAMSLWEQFIPPLGDRAELTVSGLTDWVAFQPKQQIRTVHSEVAQTFDGENILVMDTELVVYESTTTECGEE